MNYKDKLPMWWKQINSENQLILTNDIDSLLSCKYLERKFGCKVTSFYDFERMFNKPNWSRVNSIGVDLDQVSWRCFGNHATPRVNPDCIGLNSLIDTTGYKYGSKFAGSTIMQLMWLYDEDFSQMSLEQLTLLLLVDVSYKQYYSEAYNAQWHMWYDEVMGIGQYLEPVLKQFDLETFNGMYERLGLRAELKMNEFGLEWTKADINIEKIAEVFGWDMSLPEFNWVRDINTTVALERKYGNVQWCCKMIDYRKIYSAARTSAKYCSYSQYMKKEDIPTGFFEPKTFIVNRF